MKPTIQDYKKDAILNKVLRYEEGIMSRRQWLKMMQAKGWNVAERTARNHAAEKKLEEWLYDNRSDISGNENWPPTKRYFEQKEVLKAGIFKTEYLLIKGNSLFDITKTEYEHFKALQLAEDINTQKNEIPEKIEAGTATKEEVAEYMEEDFQYFSKYAKD